MVAEKGERSERVHERLPVISQSIGVADDREGSPPHPLLRFFAEQMLSSPRAKPSSSYSDRGRPRAGSGALSLLRNQRIARRRPK